MAEQKRDYYEVLGIAKDASDDDIKKAYRRLAKKYHPDSHPGDREAEEKFKEASEAYAVLSDPEKRQRYDQYGHAAFDGTGGFGPGGFDFNGADFGDIFGDIFGSMFGGGPTRTGRSGPMKGASIRTSIRISFMESVTGCEKEISLNMKDPCASCGGSGARPGSSPQMCPRCGGKGQVVFTQQSFFGNVRSVQPCPDCQGSGQIIKDKCPVCGGSGYTSSRKTIRVSIPAGIDNGQSVRIREKGEPGMAGGPRGDLLVEVLVEDHPIFIRQNFDIFSTVKISYAQAALGSTISIDTVDGKVAYEVKPGTQTDTRIRLRSKGVPSLRNKSVRGDHYVTLVVEVPARLSREAKDLLRQFDALTGNSLHDPEGEDDGSGSRKKKFWGK